MRRAGMVIMAAVALSIGLGGCNRRSGEPATESTETARFPADGGGSALVHVPGSEMPGWLDLYKSKGIVSVATVDNVVIVTFETLGQRDEVFGHYTSEFASEESFVSFRDNRDIISFLRDGYGVKITLLDQSKNRWTLEYHKQVI